ncbi:endonuclease domain-containing protein [Microbacterium sp.]|uniref:endonuclease domain-containing protein n=1 Tax=Microbacterium sp. TaxID=51671 RepID=UPI003F944A10
MNEPTTFDDCVSSCAVRLKPGQRFGRTTAARLWGLPLPTMWKEGEAIDVVVPTGTTPPKTAGIRGSRLKVERAETRILKGVPVVDPIAALFQCAQDLTVEQAVVMIDALVTPAMNYPGLGPGKPMATLAEIEARLSAWRQFPGYRTIRRALPLARFGVESPKESETRLLIIGSGLPEPTVQHEVWVAGEMIARLDLAYPRLKIGIEYDGDGHRTEKDEWRRDIRRQRALHADGWNTLHLTEDDLAEDERDTFIEQVRHAIAMRTK